jgi:hypothetical protein
VEDSCEYGSKLSGSIKCWKFLSSCANGGFSIRAQLHGISYLIIRRSHQTGGDGNGTRDEWSKGDMHINFESQLSLPRTTHEHRVPLELNLEKGHVKFSLDMNLLGESPRTSFDHEIIFLTSRKAENLFSI